MFGLNGDLEKSSYLIGRSSFVLLQSLAKYIDVIDRESVRDRVYLFPESGS